MRQIVFLFAVFGFLSILISLLAVYLLRAHKVSTNDWSLLLGRLKRIDRDKFFAVALDLLDGVDADGHLDPDLIFEMIGGMRGLDALEQNSEVLVDLAAYVQRWYPEALQLAEELRLNAREIKWHVGRLRGAAQTGHLQDQFPIYAQRAVATYYLMTRSLLVLYEGINFPAVAELQRAI